MEIGKNFAGIVYSLIIIAFLGICYAVSSLFAPVKIKSENLIKPKIEIIVNENKIDTLYIYEKP